MFLVRDTQAPPPGRLLALKILLPSLASNEDFLKMFFTEAKIAAQLQHPNVVGITGFGQVDGIYCLAMEYVFGASLSQVLRASARAKRPLTVGVLLRITSEVCDALHYAHELRDETGTHLGLVHRDVTPQNILVGFNGVPKLADFGIAKATNRGWETQAGIVKGKFSYMSPEQALGKKVDRRSDIFGTGIVLWEALTGRDLFKGSTPMEVLTAIREQKIEPPSKVVPGLTPIVDPIVMKALRRSPRQRYQTGAEMRDDIENLIRRAGVSIDTQTISREFAGIYGDDIVERAFALRAAMAGRGELQNLAKALGGTVLEQKHLPEFHNGVNDPDPLGLFSGGLPDLPADRSIDNSVPARIEASFSAAPAISDEFEIVEGIDVDVEDDEDLVPYDSDEQRNAELLVPPERVVNGWEDSTAMSVPPSDELLSMLSEEDATIGFLPPEFASVFGRDLEVALEEVPEEAQFDDELTVGIANVPELAELRSLSDDGSMSGQWDDMYPEPPIPGPRTEALPSSYGLQAVPGSSESRRAIPRAPSLDMGRPFPRAPSLDMDDVTPVPKLGVPNIDPTDEPPIPSRPPLSNPPPPPPPRSLSDGRIDRTDPVDDIGPPAVPPLIDTDEVPSSMPGELVMLDSMPPSTPSSSLPAAHRGASPAPPVHMAADLAGGPPFANPDALSPDALRALASNPTPILDGAPAADAAVHPPSAIGASQDLFTPSQLDAVPSPPADGGVRLSPTLLALFAILLLAVGAAIGLLVANGL